MGLFDALPLPASSTKPKREEEEGEEGDATRSASATTNKKQKISETETVPNPPPPPVSSSSSSMDDRLEKLSKHMNRKFETCSRAFLELISKPEHVDALERKHGKKIVAVMRSAMETYLLSRQSKNDSETATLFYNLFEAMVQLTEKGIVGKNVKVNAEMLAWELYCRTMPEITTSEDSFALNASTKRLKKAFEEAPRRKKEEENEEEEEEESEEEESDS